MICRVEKINNEFELFAAEGPLQGRLLGSAEEVQVSASLVDPTVSNCLALGEIRAVWGLTVRDDLSLDAATTRGLGIGKSFRTLRFPRRARYANQREKVVLVDDRGAMLKLRNVTLHLRSDSAMYSL